ncbi:mRNA interferase YafQ [Zymomonas mobilis]|uniref:type II toxin-antitoxin system YafQ family toxin n=1 Tax=Zymomonas mobilis TaxID=542 RepID=UPI00026D820B|nr:type II toxin-antitoxin system YafQ family toxin [Zymomonas mobilis]AFN57601.1 addiction module toxin, RelE/StbE family [Zymomonas mobilis subsp. mobilis ATCC 29191]TQK74369.1 mRNA interferase YafQ [Zymomonas mobilis]TQL14624.1 mRNA interferase YafQ [Zymomonas mobilis]
MALKRTANSKRTSLPRSSDYTKSFLKDWKRLLRSGRYDLNRLKSVMMLLIENDEPLSEEWLDHPLKGEMAAYRECHIGGDFLLIYRIDDSRQPEIVIFVRAGTHSELLE